MWGMLIALAGATCLATALLVVVVGFVWTRNRQATGETALLATELGLERIPGSSLTIFGGAWDGHPIALSHVFVRDTLGGADARRGGAWKLRLAVGLRRAEALDASVYRASTHVTQANLSGVFDADFQTRNPGNIGEEAREALTAFARAHGHLSLSDRPQLLKLLGGGPVLSGSKALILHDEPGLGQTSDVVRALLDDLVAAIRPLEASA